MTHAQTHFSQYPGASFITFFYTNGAFRLLVWFKVKKNKKTTTHNNSERWGNRVESHVKKAWTTLKALARMREA